MTRPSFCQATWNIRGCNTRCRSLAFNLTGNKSRLQLKSPLWSLAAVTHTLCVPGTKPTYICPASLSSMAGAGEGERKCTGSYPHKLLREREKGKAHSRQDNRSSRETERFVQLQQGSVSYIKFPLKSTQERKIRLKDSETL